MPYYPSQNLNRVENIKKKFEANQISNSTSNVSAQLHINNEFSSMGKSFLNSAASNKPRELKRMLSHQGTTSPVTHHPKKHSLPTIQLISQNNNQTSKENVPSYSRSISSNKAGVKRSPAFRCDKVVCGRNVSNVSRCKSPLQHTGQDSIVPLDLLTSCNNVNTLNPIKEMKPESPAILPQTLEFNNKEDKPCDNKATMKNLESTILFKRSNTDLNLFKSNNKGDSFTLNMIHKLKPLPQNNEKPMFRSTLVSKQKDLLENKINEKMDHPTIETSRKVIPEYSILNKKNKTIKDNLKISENFKDYLTSPLPKGPPPKKPPRTFVHKLLESNQENSAELEQKTLETKNGVLDAKVKLQKLESILTSHHKSGHIIVPKQKPVDKNKNESCSIKHLKTELGLDDLLSKTSDQKQKKLLEVIDVDENLSRCFLNCAHVTGEDSQKHFYEKRPEMIEGQRVKKKQAFIDELDQATKLKKPLNGHKAGIKQEMKVERTCVADKYLKEVSGTISSQDIKTDQHIYDVPVKNRENQKQSPFSTFGKHEDCDIASNNNVTKSFKKISKLKDLKLESDLHYMCTTLVEPAVECTQHPPAVSTCDSNNPSSMEVMPTPCDFNYDYQVDTNEEGTLKQFNLRLPVPKMKEANYNGPRKASDTSSTISDSDSTSVPSTPEEKRHAIGRLANCKGDSKKTNEKEEFILLSQQTARRKGYLQRVSSTRIYGHNLSLEYQNKNSAFTHLFESCLLVGLTLSDEYEDSDGNEDFGKREKVPYIKSKFPPNVDVPAFIESFCFPDANDWPPSSDNQKPEEQYYSIVFTNENGGRKFGYCRRVLPEGAHFCLPLAYCIISPYRANGFYYKVLKELESRHGSPGIETFMKQLYDCEFPNPGESLKLNQILAEVTYNASRPSDMFTTTLVRRPIDMRLEERDLSQLLETLKLPVFLKVFSSLLLERKVLLLSNSLSKLSSCIEALQSILNPFSWQHSYIPVLPAHLLEICEAPTPYVIGLLKPKEGTGVVTSLKVEEGIIVDLEESRILHSCKDETSILPSQLKKKLKADLTDIINKTGEDYESSRNVLISEAFIKLFLDLCGHYINFIAVQQGGLRVFQKEAFIRAAPSRDIQSFLEWFTETAMFHAFLEEAVQYESESVFPSNVARPDRAKKGRTIGERIKELAQFK